MKPGKIQYKIKVWYRLSCGCVSRLLLDRIQNTGKCPRCWYRVFVIDTVYEKPDGEF